jgi:hypothetical protein
MNDPSPMGRPIPAIAVLAAITLAITLIPLAEPTNHAYYRAPHAIDFGRTAVILALAFTAVYFLCSWVYMAYHRAGVAIVVWLLLAWGAPIVVDLIHYGLAESRDFEQIASIASCSPIGALIIIWDPNNHHTNPTPGIVMQLLIASLPFVLCMIVVMRRRARRARL